LSGFPQSPVGKKRLSKSGIKGLLQSSKKLGANHKEWYVVYEDVLLSNISLIQRWNSEEWISMMKEG
jgi:hypothetical protein